MKYPPSAHPRSVPSFPARSSARCVPTGPARRLTALALASACSLAVAQTATPPTGPALETIVVTASGHEQRVADAPASITVITRETLEKGAYRDLTDALRDVPGVVMTQSDNNTSDITIRGMGPTYTLILVDGRRMSTRETQTNGSTGTDQSWVPPLEAIERIEVVRGPMSSLYGSDAMGGVINIITRKVPRQWGGSLRADATVQEDSDSGNAYQGNFYLAGPLVQDLLGLSLNGIYSVREEDDILNGYNDHTNRGVTARLSFTPDKRHDITLEAGSSRQHYVSTPGKTLAANGTLSDRPFEREQLAIAHKGRWGFATSDSHVQRETVRNVARDMTIENTVFNSAWTLPLGLQHVLTAGAYYNRQNLTDTTTNRISSRSTADRTQYAVFAEDEWRLSEQLALTGGLRFDDDETGGSQWSPRLYAVWHVTPAWTVKGGVSTGFRAPSLRQTLGDWGATSRGGNIYGNPDLKPEKSLSKEIGLLYRDDGGLSGSLTVFDNEFTDKITRIACPTCGPANAWGNLPTTYVNVDDAITRGVEATLSAPLARRLKLVASYTYTESEQKSGAYAGSPLTQLPEHLLSASLNWTPTDPLEAWTKLSYRGKESQPTTGPSSGSVIAPSATFLDIGANYKVNKSVSLQAGIYNLLDEDVTYEEYSYVEDGRRYWVGVTYKF